MESFGLHSRNACMEMSASVSVWSRLSCFSSQVTCLASNHVSEQSYYLPGSEHLDDFSLPSYAELFHTFLFLTWVTLVVSLKRSKMEEKKVVDQHSPLKHGFRTFFTSLSCSFVFLVFFQL